MCFQVINSYNPLLAIAESAGAVECADCFSAEGQDPIKEGPEYDSKQSDGDVE